MSHDIQIFLRHFSGRVDVWDYMGSTASGCCVWKYNIARLKCKDPTNSTLVCDKITRQRRTFGRTINTVIRTFRSKRTVSLPLVSWKKSGDSQRRVAAVRHLLSEQIPVSVATFVCATAPGEPRVFFYHLHHCSKMAATPQRQERIVPCSQQSATFPSERHADSYANSPKSRWKTKGKRHSNDRYKCTRQVISEVWPRFFCSLWPKTKESEVNRKDTTM